MGATEQKLLTWEKLRDLAETARAKRIFLVCGNTVYAKTGVADKLAQFLPHVEISRFSSFAPNPSVESASAAYDEFAAFGADMLIAAGGGSAIDVAKGLKSKFLEAGEGVMPPFVAIPTTSGSGSDATRFAVLYIGDKKLSLDRPELRPDYALLDPSLTYGLPRCATATTGLDAIAQCIESIWSVSATSESTEIAYRGLELLLPSIRDAVRCNTQEARAAMMEGAHLSGCAIDITRTTAAHAFSYAFTKKHGLPHGHSVWLTLPALCEYNHGVADDDSNHPDGAAHVRGVIERLAQFVAGQPSAQALAAHLRQLAQDIGIELSLPAIGVRSESDLLDLLSRANVQRMANNPRKPSLAALASLLWHNR